MRNLGKFLTVALFAMPLMFAGFQARAIVIATDTSAASLAAAFLTGPGINITGQTLLGHTNGLLVSSGTYSNGSGTYGIGSGIVLSTGHVGDYADGPNEWISNSTNFRTGLHQGKTVGTPVTDPGEVATAAQEDLLDPITGGTFTHYDVTQLDIEFDMVTGFDTVFFNLVFGSEEFIEYVGSEFIDGFGLYLNGVNIAQFAGDPVNIDHPSMAAVAGTELDGILDPTGGSGNPIMQISGFVGDGSTGNTLTIIIADTSDGILDSTIYLQGFSGEGPPGSIPEPGTLVIFGFGLAALGFMRRRRAA